MKARPAASLVLMLLMTAAMCLGAALRGPAGAEAGRRLVTGALLLPLAGWDWVYERLDSTRVAARPAIRRDERPLRRQAAEMWADLERRFLADRRFLLISTPPVEIGDACLWQGVYAATTALAYEQDPSPAALRRAEGAFDGLAVLGYRGRPIARVVLPLSVRTEPPGRWYYRDARYQWKEDASVDSAAGWILGALLTLEAVPTRRREALDAVQRFADQLIAGGFRLRNSDGSATRYGSAGGDLVGSPVGLLVTLAALNTLARHGRGGLYAEYRERFIREGRHRWAAFASAPAPGRLNTTNHNIAFLSLTAVLLSEDDPEVAAVYARGMLRLSRLTSKMDNAFWVYLADWALSRSAELAPIASVDEAYLAHRARRPGQWQRAKRAMLEWHYPYNKLKLRRAALRRRPREPLPISDRPAADFIWQRSPYERRGWANDRMRRGIGQSFSPLDFLAAYSLGRAIGAIEPGD